MLFVSPVFLVNGVGTGDYTTQFTDAVDIPISAEASWLSGWSFRKSHVINGSTGAGTDYQISINVHFGSGTDNGTDVYCASLVNTDFSDIRFTDDDGITELDYWMEESHVSDNATFWVEVRDNLDTHQSIFIYFNNEAAVTSSDGSKTFLLFDDFDGVADSEPSTDLWYVKSGLNGIRLDGNSHLILDDEVDAGDRGSIYTKEVYGPWNLSILSRTWCSSGTVRNMNWGGLSNYTVSDGVSYWANSWTDGIRFATANNGIQTNTDGYVDNLNAWHLYDLTWFPEDAYFFQDENEKFHHTTNIADSRCNVSLGEGTAGGGAYALVDWIVLRNCIASEPSHGEWGTLEVEPVDGLDWLSGWEFRKSHSIEGSLGAGNDYQVKIVVHNGTGVDSADEFYCNGYCLPNFGDIRFTDNDGITEFDYWMEESHVSDNATFWVEILDTLDYDQVIYVYFGNPDAVNVSDGVSTFIFFDDFENNDLDRWDTSENAWSIQSSVVKHGSYAARGNAQASNRGCRTILDSLITTDVMFHTWVRVESTINYKYPLIAYEGLYNPSDDAEGLAYIGYIHENDWATYNGTAQYYEMDTVSANTWHEYEVGVDFTNGFYRPYIDGNAKTTHTLDVENGSPLSQIYTVAMVTCAVVGAHDQWQDDFYIRKFVSDEPTHGSWSALESAMFLTSVSSTTYEPGTTGNTVLWSAFSYHPFRYLQFVDDALLANSSWDGSNVELSADGLDIGSHNFTLQIFNTLGYSLSRSITVIVEDTTDPVLTHPADFNCTIGSEGNTIQWNMTDLYPDTYEIYLGNELLRSGSWNSTGETVSVSVDGFPVGEYNLTLTASDESGNTASDSVTVTVTTTDQIDTIIIIIMIAGVVVVLIVGAIVCRRRP